MIKDLTPEMIQELTIKARKSRADIVAMTHLAASGHPGGSMSSIDIYTLLYHIINMDTDKVVISHGHTSPAVYSALARKGLFSPKEAIKGFRRVGSISKGTWRSRSRACPGARATWARGSPWRADMPWLRV